MAPRPEQAGDDLYAEATAAYQARDFTRAIALYDRVIALQPHHAEAHYKRANALKDLGQLDAALSSYDDAIRCKPDFQYAWCNRGAVQQALGSNEAALTSFEQAISLNPGDVFAHSNRAFLLQHMSRWQEALASYDRVLALNSQLPHIWFQRANILQALRQPDAALRSYREAVKLNPDYPEAHYNCGVLLERSGEPAAALASYERAIQLQPEFYLAQYNRAGLLKQGNQLQAALEAYDRTLAIKPDSAESYCNRGAVLQELGRTQAALASYDHALALQPNYAQCYVNRSTLYASQKQWDRALEGCAEAISIRPDCAEAYGERAGILMQIGQPDAALADYDRAVTLKPDFAQAQYNRALALLLKGDYRNGWLMYEWRWRNADKLGLPSVARFSRYPLWLGTESIAGKRLLIHTEQGLGDTLQFCRFVSCVAKLGAQVSLEVMSPLAGLLSRLDGVSEVLLDSAALPEVDYRCPLMSLPLALKTTLDTIPLATGYLRSDPARVAEWRSRLGEASRPRIGIAWSGNSKQGNDHNRSFRLAEWIGQLPREFDYVCLQKDIRPEDEPTLADNPWIQRYDAQLRDFDDTAALCQNLDLVISVCTSVAHLSGALGRPTWVLVPFNADWRWLLDRTDSPWYQSVKLYRQQAIGDWCGVFGRLATQLRATFPATG